MFLTVDDIERLTGCKRKLGQCAYLKAENIPYRVNARGEPVVTVAYINGAKKEPNKTSWQPKLLNLSA